MVRKLFILILSLFILSCGDDLTYEQKIKNYNFCISKADSLIQVNDYKEAIAYSNTAIEITDTLSAGFIKKGDASYELNWLDVAEENFNKAIKIEGKSSKIYKSRALLYLKMKDSDFLDDIDTYLKSYGDDEEAHELRRDYLESQNELDDVIEEYTRGIKNHKDSIELYVRRSEIYLKNKDYDEALNDYDKILSMRPDSPEIIKKNELLKNMLYYKKNRNISIGILIAIYVFYILLSFFVLKPIVLRKAENQIGGMHTILRDPLIWILPIILAVVFIIMLQFGLIPNF